MKHPKIELLVVLGAGIALGACSKETPSDSAVGSGVAESAVDQRYEPGAQRLSVMLDRHVTEIMRDSPESATALGFSVERIGERYAHRLDSYTREANVHRVALNAAFLEELYRVDPDGLSAESLTSYRAAKWLYEGAARFADFPYGHYWPAIGIQSPYLITQISGPHIEVPQLLQGAHRVNSREDAEDFVARLEDIPRIIREATREFQANVVRGAIPPLFVLEGALAVTQNFTARSAKENSLSVALSRQLESISDLDDDTKTVLIERAELALEERVYPAYHHLATTLQGLIPKAPDDPGVWRLPNGPAFYEAAIKHFGDTDLSAEAVHELGLSEVDRILNEMDAILQSNDLTEGSVADRMRQLENDTQFRFLEDAEGRDQVLAYIQDRLDTVNAIAPSYFATIPQQSVELRRVPEFSEDNSPRARYSVPSLDGTRPGIFWINLGNHDSIPKFSLPTLTYHEAVPGHHFQLSMAMAIEDLPLVRRLSPFNAYVEGWALYAERLAKEMGLYDDDPYGDLGRLQRELHRAIRLVVDTGMHYKRWSREQAIEYMTTTSGIDDSEVTVEIERYAVWPGQALGYKIGMLKFLELRERMRRRLGNSFDIKLFHDAVLKTGAIPLDVLEAHVEAVIEASAAE